MLGKLFCSRTLLAGLGAGICSPRSVSGSKEQIVSMCGQEAQTSFTWPSSPSASLGRQQEERSLGFFFSGASPSLEVTIALSGSQLPWKQAAL